MSVHTNVALTDGGTNPKTNLSNKAGQSDNLDSLNNTTTTPAVTSFKKGTVVKIASGATYYDGKTPVPARIIKKQWIVKENSVGDRVVIDKAYDGSESINSPINSKYLTVVSTAELTPPTGGSPDDNKGNAPESKPVTKSPLTKDFNCTVVILYSGGKLGDAMPIPVYPNEFSDDNSASFSSQSIFGRSVDYQIYETSSRSVSFTLNLHDELCKNHDYIHELVAYIQSACYPEYSSGVVKPPEILFIIGKQFKIRGILESCSALWKAPIIDDKLVNCDLSISVKETTGPWSGSDIRSKRGFRE